MADGIPFFTHFGRQVELALSKFAMPRPLSFNPSLQPSLLTGLYADKSQNQGSPELPVAVGADKLPDGSERWAALFRGFIQQERVLSSLSNFTIDDIILADDMEGGTVLWEKVDVAGVGAVALDTTTVFKGSKSLKVTTGGAASDATYGRRFFSTKRLTETGKIRFSVAFTPISAVLNDSVEMTFDIYDGTTNHRLDLYLPATAANVAKLQFLNAGGTYTDIATGIPLTNGRWVYLEADWNLGEDKLEKVTLNQKIYTVAKKTYTTASTATYSVMALQAATGAAAAKSAYFDEFLLRVI